jgi:hypothetical protein
MEASNDDPYELTEGIIRELNIRAKQISHRCIPLIHWRLSPTRFDASATTQIMYYLGKLFSLRPRENSFCVYLSDSPDIATHMALFRGLGFDAIELENINNELRLLELTKMAHEYQFTRIGINGILTNQSKASSIPHESIDYVIASSPPPLDRFSPITNNLWVKSHGDLYKAFLNDRLTLTHQGINTFNISDSLGIGPGATSFNLQGNQKNTSSLDEYLTSGFIS